jgi:hypothetical protein
LGAIAPKKNATCIFRFGLKKSPHFAHVVRRPVAGFRNSQNKQQLFENCPVVMKTNCTIS